MNPSLIEIDETLKEEVVHSESHFVDEPRHAPYTGGFDYRPYWHSEDDECELLLEESASAYRGPCLWDEPAPVHELPIPTEFDVSPRYHYCCLDTLYTKLTDEVLYPYVEDEMPALTSVVWTSTDPIWEAECAVARSLGLGCDDLRACLFRQSEVLEIARIVLKPATAPYRWDEYWIWAGVDEPHMKMWRAGDKYGKGNSVNWWVTPLEIPSSEWIGVQVWDPFDFRWIPLHRSRNRIQRELIPLLPQRLRGPDRSVSSFNRLCRDAYSSGVLPWNDTTDEGLDNYWEEESQNTRYTYTELFDEWKADLRRARRMWFEADMLAAAGIKVAPDRLSPSERELCHVVRPDTLAWATTDRVMVDRHWLRAYTGSRYAICLGPSRSGLFALRMTGTYRRGAFMREGDASTLVLDDDAKGITTAVFRAPKDCRLNPGVIIKTDTGQVDVVTLGAVWGPSHRSGKGVTRRPGAFMPAEASAALIDRLHSLRRS